MTESGQTGRPADQRADGTAAEGPDGSSGESRPTVVDVAEDRLRIAKGVDRAGAHPFPKHWSFLLGEIALYSFLVLVATGVYLTFFYKPSLARTTYEGSYEPLQGVEVSHAYESAMRLSWDVRAGLLVRQIHHWAALVFVGAIVAHLFRNFFTGAYRRPRELNWMIGIGLFGLAIFNGFAGYSLLDDLLSGTGLRVGYSIALSVPVIGSWAAFLLFGGEYPADDILSRLYVLHILIIPALIVGLLSAHLLLVWHQRHSQMPGGGRTDRNVRGTRMWPHYATKSVGLLLLVVGVLCLLGGLVQINPIWLYGPYDPAAVTTAAQPDWYMGWVEGAMRLAGPWALDLGPYYVSALFFPAVVLPGLTFLGLLVWPFVDRRITGDEAPHEVLERPSDRPGKTAFGVGMITFYGVLLIAGAQDIIAAELDAPIAVVLWTLRITVLTLPLLTALIAFRIAVDLRDRRESMARHVDRASGPTSAAGSSERSRPGEPARTRSRLRVGHRRPVPPVAPHQLLEAWAATSVRRGRCRVAVAPLTGFFGLVDRKRVGEFGDRLRDQLETDLRVVVDGSVGREDHCSV